MLARGSRLDALTAAGDVQVATSGRAAAVPETFMLSLCRNSGIRAGAWQTAVCADCWGRQAAGLRPTPGPGGHLPRCAWAGPLRGGPAALGNSLGVSAIHMCRVSRASMGLELCVSLWS